MVSCKQCNTPNSLDSAFCKKCGATLDANDIAAANDKLTAMVADGNRLFADSRTDDALMVAETAIASNPSSAAAISLKGMCLERKGLIAEALDCFERVVELQPDSTLDKLKVNDLKNMLVVEKFEARKAPDRRMALVGAIAATVLVVTGGALFAKASAKDSPDNSKLVAMNEPTNQTRTFDEILPKESQTPQNQVQQQQQQTPVNPNIQQQPNGNLQPDLGGSSRTSRDREPIRLDPYDGGSLPQPNRNEGNTAPIIINPDSIPKEAIGGGNTKTQANTNPNQPKDPDPGEGLGGGDTKPTQPPIQNTEPKNDPGIIEINVSKGSGTARNNGGGEAPVTGNGRQALMATARSQMMSGNYSAAANTYERALRAGADQGATNQRLGQCYAQMGRNSDAIAAYTRAAGAFEKSGNTQGAEACRQAIKVLGG